MAPSEPEFLPKNWTPCDKKTTRFDKTDVTPVNRTPKAMAFVFNTPHADGFAKIGLRWAAAGLTAGLVALPAALQKDPPAVKPVPVYGPASGPDLGAAPHDRKGWP